MSPTLPVVVLPGLDGTLALREGFAGRLKQQRPATVIPYPDDPALDYANLDTFVHARLPAGRFALLGESFSGPVAIRVAQSLPGRCVALILVSTFARNPWPSWFGLAAGLMDARLCPDGVLEAIMLGAHATPDSVEALHRVTAALPRNVLQARVRAALAVDVRAVLAATVCPVLCLHGRADWLIQSRCAHEIRRLRSDTSLICLDGAHNLLMTHADDATREIGHFLAHL